MTRSRQPSGRSGGRLVESGAAVLAALALTAAAAAAGSPPLAVALVGAGLLAAVAGVVVRVRAAARRETMLDHELEIQRLALASMTRDMSNTARSSRRIEQSTRRGVAAALGIVPPSAAESAPDGSVLAAMVVLGTSRELHYVGDDEGYHRLRDAWRTIDPDAVIGHIPDGGEVGYLDRRVQAGRGDSRPVPTFVVDGAEQLERLLTGDLAERVIDILRVGHYLVVIPPALRSVAFQHRPDVTVEKLGDALVLVHRPSSPDGPTSTAP